MFSILRFRCFGLALVLGGSMSSAFAGAPSNCDRIAKDVRESVTKEPSKVLMIVEDALVINESCACEIVKAAITASHADVPMAKQIVQTAIAVAPKMTPVIVDCANAVAPGAAATSDVPVVAKKSGKDAKNVQPEPIMPPKEHGSDFSGETAIGIRGVYLMAPAVGGFIANETQVVTVVHETSTSGRRRTVIIPLSPSNSMPGWTP